MQNDKANILLVDDRQENLLALEAILEPLNENLILAHSGAEALKCLLRDDFAVILMDVQMPGLDGFETATLIKEREKSRHIPILFVTAINKDDFYVFRGYSTGAVDYIFKPVHPEILQSKVAVFVELFKKGEQIKRQGELLRLGEQREKERQLAELERALERRHMEELAESEARLSEFKTTLDATLDSVFIFDAASLRFSYMNQGALKLLGYDCAAMLTMTPLDIAPDYDEAQFCKLIRPLVEGKLPSLTFEMQHRHQNGNLIPVEVFLQYIAPPGEAGRFVAIVRDITERKRAQESLILAKEAAERANRAKSEFISSVSHELRTPLNAIIGFSKLMLNPRVGPLNEDQQQYTQDVVQAAEHLLQLINDILDLAKIEAGKLKLELEPFSLADLLEQSLTIVRERALKHNLNLQVDFAPDVLALPPIIADARKVKQVMYNLLSNAVKFTPDGGSVTVCARREARDLKDRRKTKRGTAPETHERIVISVRDTGIGIAPEHQRRIFGAFEQVDSTHTREQQGTGLGLTLTKRMVEMHGGRVWFDSTVGQGSTFSFSLPLRLAPEAADGQHEGNAAAPQAPAQAPTKEVLTA